MRFLFTLLLFHVAAMIHAQEGFISLDCGSPPETNYTENGINYVSDEGFIESGVPNTLSDNNLLRVYRSHRSFPENEWNCYTLRPQKGKSNRYLIRAHFLYGDKGQAPLFDLYIGGGFWTRPYVSNSSKASYSEIIHRASSDYINVCLVNIGNGPPYISSLQLRPLDITMYEYQIRSFSLITTYVGHANFGEDGFIRYDDDKYDRLWGSRSLDGCKAVQTSETVSLGPNNAEQMPSKVMSTAITPTNSTGAIVFSVDAQNTAEEYIFYIYLAEVEKLETNQKREVNIYINGKPIGTYPVSTSMTTIRSEIFSGSLEHTLIISKTLNSTLPPILNALELFNLRQLWQNQTDDKDAAAIWSAKSTYGLTNISWQGDPCFPQEYVWVGLNCRYNGHGAANIISLNLSSRGLSGEIANALANLTIIESLDLSYNNLTGDVPEFLAQLHNLKILNLIGNNFTKPLPAQLLAKQKKGTLLLSVEESSDEDKSSCQEGSCGNNKHKKARFLVATIAIALAIVVLLSLVIVWLVKRRKKALIKREEILNLQLTTSELIKRDESFIPRKQQFTYSEVVGITNNFQKEIGRGGFGGVFQGFYEDKQVAVKMLSESSSQGYKEFQAEVKLLMLIHHTNITSLIGYCNDGKHKAIIYEFMANGNLEKHLYDGHPNLLSWERRLQIGCDAAEGLAYMHHGCTPPIVHRDVKSSNILLNERFQAKLADFGLSKSFPTNDATHVSTERVVGTFGYLDPEYYSTRKLTEKSDVYSFGVVLLELITGRKAIINGENIVNWCKSPIENGNVETITDSKLEGNFDINTVKKVVETAMSCVFPSSIKRPIMKDVVTDLRHCLQAEKDRKSILVFRNTDCVSDLNPRY